MPSRTQSHVVKVNGVSDDLIRILDANLSARHYRGRAEYIRELIRRDASSGSQPSELPDRMITATVLAESIFNDIASLNIIVEPLSTDADSREAIYAERGL